MLKHACSRVLLVTLAAFAAQVAGATQAGKGSSSDVCAFEPDAIVSDACASYSELDTLNAILRPYIQSITQRTEFFSYYRLNLFNKQCPFWSDESGMCGNIACAVNTLENEEDIPLVWRAEELGKLELQESSHSRRNVQTLEQTPDSPASIEPDYDFDEMDYCLPEEPHSEKHSDYVSLVDNPERFTGYSGVGAQQVWETIYQENCFTRQKSIDEGDGYSTNQQGGLHSLNPPAHDLFRVIQKQGAQSAFQQAIARREPTSSLQPFEFEDECMEKRVFYSVVSGMHASISTHLCWDYLNRTTGQWGPNLDCFRQKVYDHPERISKIYFNYALLLRAVSKLKSFMTHIQFRSADPAQDELASRLLVSLAAAIPTSPQIFDESIMFKSEDAEVLKVDFRDRFRNISRIMDCVGCDKCRLWGKIQTAGYGTALKILFEFDENKTLKSAQPTLRRTELVALINTLDRVSHSLYAIQLFQRMIKQQDGESVAKSLPAPQVPEKRSQASKSESNVSAGSGRESPSFQSKKHPRPPRDEPETVSEVFWTEMDLVIKTFKFVFRTWWQLPTTIWRIITFECARLWHFWLGLEPPTGGWFFRLPGMEELREL